MLKKSITALLLTTFLAIAAFADQAAYVTKKQGEAAVVLLKGQKRIRHYCAPCDDKGDKVEDIQTVDVAVADESKGYWEVKVNGVGIDLAYVYYETKDGKWKNLAKEIGVKVHDVPKYLPDVVAGE